MNRSNVNVVVKILTRNCENEGEHRGVLVQREQLDERDCDLAVRNFRFLIKCQTNVDYRIVDTNRLNDIPWRTC